MIRYWLFVATIIGSAATALASIAPDTATGIKNTTVIEKNQTWHVVNSLTVQACKVEDCSDTPQS